MATNDFKQLFKEFYSPKADTPQIIIVPKAQFLMVDGKGNPNKAAAFQDAIGALYGTVYGIKFGRKKMGQESDFSIAPLEGLWWTNEATFDTGKPDDWLWRLMIWLPDFITQQEVAHRAAELKTKKPNPALDSLRLGPFEEGLVVQIMHIGPYSAEPPTIERMLAFADQAGYKPTGQHHEIYLGDPRRAKPEKLRTIVRHPIAKK